MMVDHFDQQIVYHQSFESIGKPFDEFSSLYVASLKRLANQPIQLMQLHMLHS